MQKFWIVGRVGGNFGKVIFFGKGRGLSFLNSRTVEVYIVNNNSHNRQINPNPHRVRGVSEAVKLDLNVDNMVNGIFGELPIPIEDEVEAVNEEAVVNLVESLNSIVKELERKLEIGEIVVDEHIAYGLYCKYARLKGFSVRKGKTLKFGDGQDQLKAQIFVCSCEGTKDEKRSQSKIPEYQKPTCRCNCMAKLRIARRKGEAWKVTTFHKTHNHDMFAPDQTYLLRSARKITDEQEAVLATMVRSKITVRKAVSVLEDLARGSENVGFTTQDAYDCLHRARKKTRYENEDTFELIQHFIKKSNNEPFFYWNVEVDDDKRLMNFFFRDNRCLVDYENFGDVISFDTTYRTNKYELVCAPFVGINNHKENVMFGLAFLSNETESSFEWLFRTFLESMGGRQPETIFTDQCMAMMNAVETVFPSAQHRLCQWHISANAPKYFGSLNENSSFKYLWNKCMKYCQSEEEFEATWKRMMDNYNVGEQTWFPKMYKLRHKWASAFSNQIFSADLSATSRSEGTNSTLKKEIGNKTASLLNCVVAYEKVQENWRAKEMKKDTFSHHNMPGFLVNNPLLMHAAKVYTLAIFDLFQKEQIATIGFELTEQFTCGGPSLRSFRISSHGRGSTIRTVTFDNEKLEVKCSCHKFETVGILCSHALKVFDVVKLHFIPEVYIKKRWTKSVMKRKCSERNGIESEKGNDFVSEMAFVNYAAREFYELATRVKAHEDTRKILKECVESAKEKIDLWFESSDLNNLTSTNELEATQNNDETNPYFVRNPPLPKSKIATKNIFTRHWDVKSKKRKVNAESSSK
ncbi:hypothetical protein ACJIZ3_004625 [Penstemon smallii]|uniref:SWIM-type domain-containing protein n=1 Tax=Penstemon smallii TaxID=265156 RepID=A0ABD3S2L1_9LAMI